MSLLAAAKVLIELDCFIIPQRPVTPEITHSIFRTEVAELEYRLDRAKAKEEHLKKCAKAIAEFKKEIELEENK